MELGEGAEGWVLYGVHTPFSHNNRYNKLATDRFCEADSAGPQNSGYPLLYNHNGANHLAYCLLSASG